MKKFLIPIFITLVFAACGSKNTAFKHFNEGDAQTRGVQYTKKADIIKDNQIEVIFMSTYLNKIDKKLDATNNEVFLVSLYFASFSTTFPTSPLKSYPFKDAILGSKLVSVIPGIVFTSRK